MAETSRFYTDSGGDRQYTAADFNNQFRALLGADPDGVMIGVDGSLAISNPGTLNLDIASGRAVLSGLVYQNSSTVSKALTAVTNGYKRYDRAVIRFNSATRSAAATIITGTEVLIANTATIPAATGEDVTLGWILVTNNSGYTYSVTVAPERASSGMPRIPYFDGFTLANNSGDANNDIDISAGVCSVYPAGGNRGTPHYHPAVLTATLTKRLDAAWAAGNNQGGIDTGSKANSTWYAVHVILNDDGYTTDALFSTSATTPTLPSGYTYFRRVGWVRTDGSGNIQQFYQFGRSFTFQNHYTLVSPTSATTTRATFSAASICPSGQRYLCTLSISLSQTNLGENNVIITPGDVTIAPQSPSSGPAWSASFGDTSGSSSESVEIRVPSSTTQTFAYDWTTGTAASFTVTGLGYEDPV